MQLRARLDPSTAAQTGVLEPEREFIICGLDLISGLAEGIGPPIEALLSHSQLRDLLLQCCQVAYPLYMTKRLYSTTQGGVPLAKLLYLFQYTVTPR